MELLRALVTSDVFVYEREITSLLEVLKFPSLETDSCLY